jgi:hypothetical protein
VDVVVTVEIEEIDRDEVVRHSAISRMRKTIAGRVPQRPPHK